MEHTTEVKSPVTYCSVTCPCLSSTRMWKILLILAMSWLFSASAHAESVILSDGSVLKGQSLKDTPDSLVAETSFGTIRLGRQDILSVQAESASTAEPSATKPVPRLEESYGVDEDRAATRLIARVWGEDTAAAFQQMDRTAKATFLDIAWEKESRLLHTYYYGYHLGLRHFTVSPAFFERDGMIPRRYVSDFPTIHDVTVWKAKEYAREILRINPDDAVAMGALGYLCLELDEIDEARKLFTKAVQKNRRFVEARNGRALAYMRMHHQKARALKLFRETVAMDRTYVGALYAMGMCHIAMMGHDRVGLDEYFGRIVEADPNHPDAYYKLGAFNEALRRMDRAAEMYSRQLAVNPSHRKASERLAQVSMMLKGASEQALTHEELERLSGQDPSTYLPLLAESFIDRDDYERAGDCFSRYIAALPAEESAHYSDLSLLADPKTVEEIDTAYPREERRRLIRQFWVLADPTPTTPLNERKVEHHRRVYHARKTFADGIDRLSLLGWDKRGDVYIRFGAPDHQSWSDFLVFETKPAVAKVKKRINHLAHDALLEILPPRHLHGASVTIGGGRQVSSDVRGIPTFPLPRRTTIMSDGVETGYEWESWIYGNVGGGIEVTFIDEIGKGFYAFAQTPPGSPNRLLWQSLAPETVVGRIVNKQPSTYSHDHGGDPIGLFAAFAAFRGDDGKSDFEVYLGVPTSDASGGGGEAILEREVTVYDRNWNVVHREAKTLRETVEPDRQDGLVVDQLNVALRPGEYLVAAQVRQPSTGGIQIHKSPVTVTDYTGAQTVALSDLELAGRVSPAQGASKFRKGSWEVVPLPTQSLSADTPVNLYFEIYGLTRDDFGKTNYQVDYEVETQAGGLSIVSTLGRLIGQGPDDLKSRVSYEHTGDTGDEKMNVSLSLPEASGPAARITVRVTDLGATGHPSAHRSMELTIAE